MNRNHIAQIAAIIGALIISSMVNSVNTKRRKKTSSGKSAQSLRQFPARGSSAIAQKQPRQHRTKTAEPTDTEQLHDPLPQKPRSKRRANQNEFDRESEWLTARDRYKGPDLD